MGDPLGFGESFPFGLGFRLWQRLLAGQDGLWRGRIDHGSKCGRGGGKGEEGRDKRLGRSQSEGEEVRVEIVPARQISHCACQEMRIQ